MNSFSLGGSPVNGSGSTASFSYLPASTATFTVKSFERVLNFLPASTATISVTATGSIISISPFAPSTASFGASSSGTLYNVTPFAPQAMTAGVAMAGNPILTGGLSVSASLGVDMSGMPRRITYFGNEQMAIGVALAGDALRAIRYLSGALDLSVAMSGPLLSFKPMSGSMSFGIDAAGSLAVNATEQDLPENTMVRLHQERTMVRA